MIISIMWKIEQILALEFFVCIDFGILFRSHKIGNRSLDGFIMQS